MDQEGVSSGCFEPRHGLRVEREGRVVTFEICYTCGMVRITEGRIIDGTGSRGHRTRCWMRHWRRRGCGAGARSGGGGGGGERFGGGGNAIRRPVVVVV
jgi:hypothetical protein